MSQVLHKSELQKACPQGGNFLLLYVMTKDLLDVQVEENDSIEFCEVPLSELKFADVARRQ